jgi:hypothetical protein
MPTRCGIALGRESLHHGHRVLPLFFFRSFPNQLVGLYHFYHSVPSGLAMTTASLRAVGIALCHFVAWLWCPMIWFGSWIVPTFVQPSSVPWQVGRKSAGPILPSSSLVLNPRRSSKMWIEPLACLVIVALLIPLPRFLSLPWRVDQRKVNLVFPSYGTIVLKLLYACTLFVHSISVVLAVTTAPLRTLGMS